MVWSSILPSFLASMVEFDEVLTIVLVVGVSLLIGKVVYWGLVLLC